MTPTKATNHEVVLGWPPKELNPNFRSHWSVKSKATKAYKTACWALCKEAGLMLPEAGDSQFCKLLGLKLSNSSRYHLWITFYPPDRRARDDDNMIASFKAGRDGLALALGIDDKRFITHPFVSDQIGGFVRIKITAGPEG